MKLILTFLLFSTVCLSQGKAFTTTQINSIVQLNEHYGVADGKTVIKNRHGKIIGSGGFSIQTYLNYFNQDYYTSLTNLEKRKYNREKDSELIKGTYFYNVTYTDGGFQTVESEFYYRNKILLYVKINVIQRNKFEKEKTQQFELSVDQINEGKPIKNVLLFDAQSWTYQKNIDILEFYNKS